MSATTLITRLETIGDRGPPDRFFDMALGQALLTKPLRVQQLQTQVQGVVQNKTSARNVDQQVKLEQSLEVVQTLLGASVSITFYPPMIGARV